MLIPSTRIHAPLATISSLCSACWTAYGIAIKDIYVCMPNIVGLILGLVQLSLVFVYGQRNASKPRLSDITASSELSSGSASSHYVKSLQTQDEGLQMQVV
jgi:hypothetical protein